MAQLPVTPADLFLSYWMDCRLKVCWMQVAEPVSCMACFFKYCTWQNVIMSYAVQ